jgi:hypothetical protein
MSKIKVLLEVLRHPASFKYTLLSKYPQLIKDDRRFLEYMWKKRMDYPLNLDNPQTFNEKLQWLKLYDHRPEYTVMVDKYEVKNYVAGIIGEEHIIPTIAVYDTVEEIDFEKLPCQFVLKCTHDSGGLVICKDKAQLNIKNAKMKLRASLKRSYYLAGREWPYKNVRHRIIAEKYMVDESGKELKDYKFFCFNGKPQFLKIDFNRYINHHANYYSLEGKLLPFGEEAYPRDISSHLHLPDNLGSMIELAKTLSSGIPFVRVDFYSINNKICFGELTFYPASGMGALEPKEWDLELGNLLQLPEKKYNDE